MDSQVPSLQQYCYDLLAEYSGYIQDLDGIYPSYILEIGLRSNPFGLINIESIAETLDLSLAWEKIFNSNPEQFNTSLKSLVQGPDYHKQVVLCSSVNKLLNNQDLDDEDLQKFLSLCHGLKIVEITKINRLNTEIVLGSFLNLIHLNLADSKIGPSAGVFIDRLLNSNQCLQTLNLRNCILLDEGVQGFLQSLQHTKIITFILCWNDLTFKLLSQLCEIILAHHFLSIIDLSNNVRRQDVLQLRKLTNHIKSIRKISIT